MNRLPNKKRAHILHLLVEGNSIRGAARIAGVSKDTVMSLLVSTGAACAQYQDKHFRDLSCKIVQVDEIHSFVYAREKNRPDDKKDAGTVWTWVAIDAETKLIPCWRVGGRDLTTGEEFMADLAARMGNRIQLTSDGFTAYEKVVDKAFGCEVDYAMLVKMYEGKRYNGAYKKRITGKPDPSKISTSFIERANLTMRMDMRRFQRRTNAFSKKIENHSHAIALHFMHYNYSAQFSCNCRYTN